MLKRKNTWLKMAGLVLIGVFFGRQIKDFITKIVPASKDLFDKVQ